MKKGSHSRRARPAEDSLERYDWSKATRGRYAKRFPREAHAVVVDPALWPYFGDAAAVNAGLRTLVHMATVARKIVPKATARAKRGKAA